MLFRSGLKMVLKTALKMVRLRADFLKAISVPEARLPAEKSEETTVAIGVMAHLRDSKVRLRAKLHPKLLQQTKPRHRETGRGYEINEMCKNQSLL